MEAHLFYLATLLVVFASVVSVVLGARYLLGGRGGMMRDRIRRFTAPAPAGTVAGNGETSMVLRATLKPLARLATPTSSEELGRVRASLSQAGFRSDRALTIYLSLKVLFSLVLGLAMIWLLSRLRLSMTLAGLLTVAAMAVGFYGPAVYVMARVRSRQAAINHALPTALDLLVTCVEAGLGLDEGMNRVAAEIGLAAPILAQELRQSTLEMSAGLSRGDAFRRLADRTGVEEVRMLAAIIVQTEMFGSSVARSLRVQSSSMRLRRMQLAEERAAKVGVKMTIPLIFCIIPSLFIVLVGPGVIRIASRLLPVLFRGGH